MVIGLFLCCINQLVLISSFSGVFW